MLIAFTKKKTLQLSIYKLKHRAQENRKTQKEDACAKFLYYGIFMYNKNDQIYDEQKMVYNNLFKKKSNIDHTNNLRCF